jgi:hypothetical protein
MMQQVKVDAQAFVSQMQDQFEQAMRQVASAVNAAADGQWIEGSEEEVCQVMAEFRQRTYEAALQMRADAAEASFSPSDR